MSAQTPEQKQAILDSLDPSVKRVLVKTATGTQKWRTIDPGQSTLEDADEILFGADGLPRTMTAKPGRPRKAAPQQPVNPKAALVVGDKHRFYRGDKLLQKINKDIDSDDVLRLVMQGFAEESASLGFERLQAELRATETSQISIRRINALKAVADTWLKRKEQLANRSIDLSSTAFSRLFAFIVETFREVLMNLNYSPDEIQVIMTKLSDRLSDDTWEEEARSSMKGRDG